MQRTSGSPMRRHSISRGNSLHEDTKKAVREEAEIYGNEA